MKIQIKKKITWIRRKQTQAQTWTEIYYILNVSMFGDTFVYQATFEAQVMKKLSNTEAQLKNRVAY